MNPELQRYINDHFAGSEGAILLLTDLISRSEEMEEKRFFVELKAQVENDRSILAKVLEAAELETEQTVKAAGKLTAKAGRLKLQWEGMKPDELGHFEACEMLALGIQGKRLLWRVLAEIAPFHPNWHAFDFHELERGAERQRDAMEAQRMKVARRVFGIATPDP
jgi:hypothetical protein